MSAPWRTLFEGTQRTLEVKLGTDRDRWGDNGSVDVFKTAQEFALID
jgi:hypothetical protein